MERVPEHGKAVNDFLRNADRDVRFGFRSCCLKGGNGAVRLSLEFFLLGSFRVIGTL
jgi:hypothetical protein